MEKRVSKLLGMTLAAGLGAVLSGPLMATSVSTSAATRISGIIQTDAATFDGDTHRGFDDSLQVRRAEISLAGQFAGTPWSYLIGLDLKEIVDNSGVHESDWLVNHALNNTWLGYSGLRDTFLSVGRVSVPDGLENWGSAGDTTFLERSMVSTAFAPPDGVGVFGEYVHGNWTVAGAVVTPDVYNPNGLFGNNQGDDHLTWGTRATFSPVHDNGHVLHFGASYWRQQVKTRSDFPELGAQPEVSVRNTPDVIRMVSREAGEVDYTKSWGVEAAGVWGPWSAQGEYQRYSVYGRNHDGNHVSNLHFPGYYAQVAYVITGESRVYSQPSATFGNPIPSSPCGAWELALRYSSLDLSDGMNDESPYPLHEGPSLAVQQGISPHYNSSPQPGKTRNWTVGLNWYATDNVKFQLNYISSDTDYRHAVNLGPDQPLTSGGQKDRDMDIFALRAQVRF